MTVEFFTPLAHKWETKTLFKGGRHPTYLEKSCSACKLTGRKSNLEGCAPCPGSPHSEACLRQYMWKTVNGFFECQCGRNKDHGKKPFWKVHVCKHCDRPHGTYFDNATRCTKSPGGFHQFVWRGRKPA